MNNLFSVTYEGTDEREKCDRCWCCTRCSSDCSKACEGRVEEESEDEAVVRILGLETETVAGAEAVRRQLVIESEILYADDDTESDDPENEYSEEEIWLESMIHAVSMWWHFLVLLISGYLLNSQFFVYFQ